MFIKINKNILIATVITLVYNYVCYHSSAFIVNNLITKYLGLIKHNVLTTFDNNFIPVIRIFLIPYVYYFIHAPLSFYIIGLKNLNIFHKLISTFFIGSTIGAMIFIIFPTWVDREFPPIQLNSDDFISKIIRYGHSADVHCNAFPSFHCLCTYCLYIAFRNIKKDLNKPLFIFTSLTTFLILISTVLIKQHGIVDIFGGIILARISWILTNKFNCDIKCKNLYDKYIMNEK